MPAQEYSIRHPRDTDRKQWDELWQGYLAFYKSSLADAVTDELWRRIHDPAHEIQCRVAVDDGDTLIGLVHFFAHAHTWYEARVCYLNDLFVNPAIRGGGIGQRLIEAVVDEGRQQGWAEIYWHTQVENQVARGLYDKITGGTDGFVNYTIDLSK
jgi:GNAT superfamily N-acetyltransferase